MTNKFVTDTSFTFSDYVQLMNVLDELDYELKPLIEGIRKNTIIKYTNMDYNFQIPLYHLTQLDNMLKDKVFSSSEHEVKKYFVNKLDYDKSIVFETESLSHDVVNKIIFLDNADDYYMFQNEFLVGRVINKLRDKIPNFVFTYPFYICDNIPTKLELEGSNFSDELICNSTDWDKIGNWKNAVIVTEKIEGRNIYDFMNDELINMTDKLLTLLQVFLALDLAYEEYNFTHYDLHGENVLIEELEEPIIIKYRLQDIETKYLVKIIDFGFSYIENPDGSGFSTGFTSKNLGIIGGSYPLYDVFKLLGFIFDKISKNTNEYIRLYSIFDRLAKFFNTTIIEYNEDELDPEDLEDPFFKTPAIFWDNFYSDKMSMEIANPYHILPPQLTYNQNGDLIPITDVTYEDFINFYINEFF